SSTRAPPRALPRRASARRKATPAKGRSLWKRPCDRRLETSDNRRRMRAPAPTLKPRAKPVWTRGDQCGNATSFSQLLGWGRGRGAKVGWASQPVCEAPDFSESRLRLNSVCLGIHRAPSVERVEFNWIAGRLATAHGVCLLLRVRRSQA